MKHIKNYEDLNPTVNPVNEKRDDWEPKAMKMPKNEIISMIEDHVVDLYFEDSDDIDLDDCPFVTELSIIHQEDYADDIYDYWDPIKRMNISKKYFIKLYGELVEKAKEKIRKFVEEEPELLQYAEDYDIYNTKKYNL